MRQRHLFSVTDGIKILVLFGLGQLLVVALYEVARNSVGIRGVDSATYLLAAETFPGDLQGRNWNSAFVGLLWVGRGLGSAEIFLVIINAALVLGASWCLLNWGRLLTRNLFAWLGPAFYLCHPLIAQWTRYVLTDSLFISGIIIFSYLAFAGHPTWQWKANLGLLALFLTLLRPNGFLLLFVFVLQLVRGSGIRHKRLTVMSGFAVLICLILFGGSLQHAYSEDNSFARSSIRGEIVWNEPSLTVKMPEPEYEVENTVDFLGYSLRHPIAVARLALSRVGLDLFQVRPWYSSPQNIFLLVVMPTFLALVLFGVMKERRTPSAGIVLLISALQAMVIAGSWASYEGRQGWWMMAPLIPFATVGANKLMQNSRFSVGKKG